MDVKEHPGRFERIVAAFWNGPRWGHVALITAGLLLAEAATLALHPTFPTISMVFFVPMVLAAVRFESIGGVICSALSVILVGPVTYVLQHAQEPLPTSTLAVEWGVFAAVTVMIGYLMGNAFAVARTRHDRLVKLSLTDVSTGLPNLNSLRQHAIALLDMQRHVGSERGLTKVAIRFTNYQDLVNAFGYGFADAAIQDMASRLQGAVRSAKYIARVAPHTLAFVVPGQPDDYVEECRGLLRPQHQQPIIVRNIPVFPSLAVGLSGLTESEEHIERFFSRTESAATEAERTSERLVIYQPGMSEREEDRVRLVGEFEHALKAGQCTLAYQPRLDLRRNRIASVEALVRWQHPERGWVPPGEFVPLVEATRLVHSLTEWVADRALDQLSEWQSMGLDVRISFNLSARNLLDPDLANRLAELLSRHKVLASMLELEITESAFIDITMSSLEMLGMLRSLGFHVAIDDFGTGYASLEYLRRLPVDMLKLDKSFILEGLSDPKDHQLVRRIVQMAKDRSLRVIAEGVETRDALDEVRKLGCDEVQGYYIARPMGPREAERVLQRRTCCTDTGEGEAGS